MKTSHLSTSPQSRRSAIHRSAQPGRIVWTGLILLMLTLVNSQGQLADKRGDTPQPNSWTGVASMPTNLMRSFGAYFPANGFFYAMGGRTSDTAGSDAVHPLEYDATANTWKVKGASYPDNQMNNMACGVLTVSGTPQIYCVGGSAAGATTSAARMFSYDPVTDTMTSLPSDNWPGNAAGTILPGGAVVAGNKLYIIGGFNISVAMTQQTWQFDPNAPAGSRWLQRLDYPMQRGYVPATSINGIIYTGGGSSWNGTTLVDSTDSYKFDPAANVWTLIAPIPRATAETRAMAVNNKMWVLGGGRTAPNPSTEVDIYDPTSNSWTTGLPFATARRNFAAGTDGSRVVIAGGYDSTGTGFLSSTELFTVPVPLSAVSRKTHSGAGTFDVPLPLTGNLGIECRSTGGTETVVVTFAGTVTAAGASVTSGNGTVGSFVVSGATVTVNLTGVTDAQRLNVTIASVNDGTTTGDVVIPMGVLGGDVNGNGLVNASDVSLTKSQVGQTVGSANFREDTNANGAINGSDVALVKANAGVALPP